MNLSLDVVSDVEEHDYMIIITVISIMVLLRQANQPTEFFFSNTQESTLLSYILKLSFLHITI